MIKVEIEMVKFLDGAIAVTAYKDGLELSVQATIKTEAQYDQSLLVIENLLQKGNNLSEEEETLLDWVSNLVEEYEAQHYPIGDSES